MDLALLCLGCRRAAATQIQPLAWELPCAVGAALTKKKRKKNPKNSTNSTKIIVTRGKDFIHSMAIKTWLVFLFKKKKDGEFPSWRSG